jgi:hypothetical protein
MGRRVNQGGVVNRVKSYSAQILYSDLAQHMLNSIQRSWIKSHTVTNTELLYTPNICHQHDKIPTVTLMMSHFKLTDIFKNYLSLRLQNLLLFMFSNKNSVRILPAWGLGVGLLSITKE